jgi:hypothetical protein
MTFNKFLFLLTVAFATISAANSTAQDSITKLHPEDALLVLTFEPVGSKNSADR